MLDRFVIRGHQGSACMLSHDLAAPGRHQNHVVFTTLEPLRPANEALLKAKKPSGRQGPQGNPKVIQMVPKGGHCGPQGCPKGTQRDAKRRGSGGGREGRLGGPTWKDDEGARRVSNSATVSRYERFRAQKEKDTP